MKDRVGGWFQRLRAWGKRKHVRRAGELSPTTAVIEMEPQAARTLEVQAETVVVGDHPQINIHRDPRQQRMLLIGFGLVLLAVTALGVGVFFYIQSQEVTQMGSEFNIAVAGFAVNGDAGDPQLGKKIGQSIYTRLSDNLTKKEMRVLVGVWGPDQAGSISGADASQRAGAAADLALKIEANIIVYGVIDVTQEPWTITPEFYVSERNFYESQEITGQYQLGEPFSVRGKMNTDFKAKLNMEMLKRVEALTWVTDGISAYANEDFEAALDLFQSAEQIERWEDPQGRSVLYLLAGNAAIRAEQYDVAEAYYRKSLELDGEYARARIGMGTMYYVKALEPFNESKNPGDLDLAALEEGERWYQSALTAQNQPDQADIETKVRYNLGQCYFLRYYSGQTEYREQSIEQFTQIIQAYDAEKNSRVKLWTGEAHARLGLIALNEGDLSTAIQEYEQAVALLDDYFERKELFQKRLEQLRATQSAP